MNISFKAKVEIDGGRNTTYSSINDSYNAKIGILTRKKEIALRTMSYLNSPEIKKRCFSYLFFSFGKRLAQLPEDDFVLFDTLSCDSSDENPLTDSMELIYFSDNPETNKKLGLTRNGIKSEGDEFLIEHKFDTSSMSINKPSICKWLDTIIERLK